MCSGTDQDISLVPADRERIIRPFKIAGLIGAYNVFAIVRGGGTTGQSGAVSLGIAKALVAHAPEVEPLLRKGLCPSAYDIRISNVRLFLLQRNSQDVILVWLSVKRLVWRRPARR